MLLALHFVKPAALPQAVDAFEAVSLGRGRIQKGAGSTEPRGTDGIY